MRGFSTGQSVKVERSDRSIEEGWRVAGFHNIGGVETVIVRKPDSDGVDLEKDVPLEKLRQLNLR